MTQEEQKQFDELSGLTSLKDFKTLCDLVGGDNALTFFGVEKQEIRHSYALANLFNVKDFTWSYEFVKFFLKEAKVNLTPLFDYTTLVVDTEFLIPANSCYKVKGYIDIILYSEVEQTVILIENKVDSDEHSNQLSKYEYGISIDPVFASYANKYYIYLTKNGIKPKSKGNSKWKSVSYKTIIEMLEKIVPQLALSPEMAGILNQYKQFIRRKIKMDKKLEDLCKQINNIYPNAVEALMQYKSNKLIEANNKVSDEIYKILKDLENQNIITALSVKAGIRGSKEFTFKSVLLANKINSNGINPIIYKIMLETAVVSEEIKDQYYVAFGNYDKSVTDAGVQSRILQIYGKSDVNKRMLNQDKGNEAIELKKVYDETNSVVKQSNQIKCCITHFIDRAQGIENNY